MPSSTSSSEAGIPGGQWAKTWAMAALVALASLALLECLLRWDGRTPAISDDMDFWCVQREAASRGGDRAVALLGTSRMQMGLVTPIFRREFPRHQVAQIAIVGRHPVATLEDLAEDPTFTGLVVCDLDPFSLLPEFLEDQGEYVHHYHKLWNTSRKVERGLRTVVQENLRIASPPINLVSLLRAITQRTPPPRQHARMRRDRWIMIDYAELDVEEVGPLNRRMLERGMMDFRTYRRDISREVWVGALSRVARMVARLRAKGGRVAFVAFPLNGPLKEAFDRQYPREAFWDEVAKRTGAVAIHSEDLSCAGTVHSADGMHLDYRNGALFTKALADELRRTGLVRHP